jgi:hypothetical protein
MNETSTDTTSVTMLRKRERSEGDQVSGQMQYTHVADSFPM